ncbi:hypothetical protein [Terasakiella pusilla]|uniref:hypothetical protein n=1 Tax=Terasakiella pusilla TaxID=64973 RepID=UPI003AA838C1
MQKTLKHSLILASLLGLSACGYVDPYEEAVYDQDPRYCYRQLGGIECFSEPVHRDAARLVSYYGRHPSRVNTPSPPNPVEPARPQADLTPPHLPIGWSQPPRPR